MRVWNFFVSGIATFFWLLFLMKDRLVSDAELKGGEIVLVIGLLAEVVFMTLFTYLNRREIYDVIAGRDRSWKSLLFRRKKSMRGVGNKGNGDA